MNVALEPSVLRWARERAGMDQEELARRVGVRPQRVESWEVTGELTLRQAEKLAQSTHAPYGSLYLDEPPQENLPISDFRTVGSGRVTRPSPELIDVIDDAMERQEWFREYSLKNAEPQLDWVGSFNGTESIEVAAREICQRLSIETSARSKARDWEDAMKICCDQLERAGVLIMKSGVASENNTRPLNVEEFRGFALSDRWAPLIFINTKDFKAAQIFTLFHELVHLWLGISGITNLNQTDASSRDREFFCNGVAAEILVPASELRERFASGVSDIAELGRYFKVSLLVMLRRLRDLGMISQYDFSRRYGEISSSFQVKENEEKESKEGGPSYYRTKVSRLGKRFVRAILESTFEGETSRSESFHLLKIRNAETLRNLAKEMKFELL